MTNLSLPQSVQLFDDFLYKPLERSLQVIVISGNHDSPGAYCVWLSFMGKSGIHMSQVYNGSTDFVLFTDDYGKINFIFYRLLPSNVRRFFEDEEINTYTEASVAISNMNMNKMPEMTVTHQNSCRTPDSEIISRQPTMWIRMFLTILIMWSYSVKMSSANIVFVIAVHVKIFVFGNKSRKTHNS